MSGVVQSLPAEWYHKEEVFQLELEKIFATNWSFAGPADELQNPGDYVTCTVANQSVVVVRDLQGGLRGFLNLCRHRASPLCVDKKGRLRQFTCPYHAWSYHLDGRLKRAPGFEWSGDGAGEMNLVPVQVGVWNGLAFACLDPDAIPLQEWLGDIAAIARDFPAVSEMKFTASRSRGCQANWKNYSDNSVEGYHLATVHRELNASLVNGATRVTPHENGKFVGFEVVYQGNQQGNPGERPDSPGYWIYKFPGLLMHFSLNGFNIEKVTPTDRNHTLIERWFWFMPSVDRRDAEQIARFSGRVMEEDIGICARVQKNLEGGYFRQGVLSAVREPGTICFQQWVRMALDRES